MHTCCECSGDGQHDCPDCDGTGLNFEYEGADPEKCLTCNGTGKKDCKKCDGTGEMSDTDFAEEKFSRKMDEDD